MALRTPSGACQKEEEEKKKRHVHAHTAAVHLQCSMTVLVVSVTQANSAFYPQWDDMRQCSLAGKVITALASHWLCVTDTMVYLSMGSMD